MAEKILLYKSTTESNFHDLRKQIIITSLKCFYDDEVRNRLKLSNLSWIGQWDGKWADDYHAHLLLDGTGGWNNLFEKVNGKPGKLLREYFPEPILHQFMYIEPCTKRQQKQGIYKWVDEVDNWLRELKGLDFNAYFDVIDTLEDFSVCVKTSGLEIQDSPELTHK